ncbi:MAG: molybdenum ABC transporter ATP-binding protein [Sphingomonadales bacterium]|jgi:molybdate transport system ATP-binding protein
MNIGFSIKAKSTEPEMDISFEVGPGLSVIFGPSGAGKTTILNMFAGMSIPESGTIKINDTVLFDSENHICLPPQKRAIGYVPQDLLLFPHMDVRSNLLYGQKSEDIEFFNHCLNMLELRALLDRYPRQLSGGEGRRLALGRALISKPKALLLDEPMAGLDPARRQRLLPFIERIRAEVNIPILYVSHYAEEAARLADDAVMIIDGKIIACAAAEDIFSHPAAEAHFGPFDLGTMLEGQVEAFEDGLARINCGGLKLRVTGDHYKPEASLRLRVLARDIAISLDKPGATSVQNSFPCTIAEIEDFRGQVLVRLTPQDAPTLTLTSMITPQSAKKLGLSQGQIVYAMIKAVAVARSRHPLH